MQRDVDPGADVVGYLLADEDQFRLERARNQLRLLAALTCPRSRADQDTPTPLSWVQLCHCFELLAEQLQCVLDGLEWPARLKAPRPSDADSADQPPG